MTPVLQTAHTDFDAGIIGNCLAACIASLFDLDINSVPWYTTIDLYEPFFRSMGLKVTVVHEKPPIDGQYYITSHKVPLEYCAGRLRVAHCVIRKNGRMVHDPKGERRIKLGAVLRHLRFSPIS